MDNFQALSKLAQEVFSKGDLLTSTPFYPCLVTFDGTVDRNGILAQLNTWVNKSATADKTSYIDALKKAESDSNLFDFLIKSIYDQINLSRAPLNVFFIANIWIFYGIAIRKCLGTYAEDIKQSDYFKYFPHQTNEQEEAQKKCIHSYNQKPGKKSNPDYLDAVKLLAPTIRSVSRKSRTVKKHVNIARKKTKRIIIHRSLFSHLAKVSPEFSDGVGTVPDQFADYALECSKIT